MAKLGIDADFEEVIKKGQGFLERLCGKLIELGRTQAEQRTLLKKVNATAATMARGCENDSIPLSLPQSLDKVLKGKGKGLEYNRGLQTQAYRPLRSNQDTSLPEPKQEKSNLPKLKPKGHGS